MIKIYIDFDGKMPYILVFGYSKAQMQKHHSIFIFVGIYFFFCGESIFIFANGLVHFWLQRKWSCTFLQVEHNTFG